MTFSYPAVFTRHEDGSYTGVFPDLYELEVDGISLQRAIDEARDAMYNWIDYELGEDEPELPMISDIDSIPVGPDQQVCMISIHYRPYVGWDE